MTGNGAAVVGGELNRSESLFAFIGGGNANSITAGQDGTIAGGYGNKLSADSAFIGGGLQNTASSIYAALVGGLQNTVSGEGAAVLGGGYNTASGEGAVVDGGFDSTANGLFATIPGGYGDSAAGTYSFAAGARANAAQTGTFVWSDGSNGDAILTSQRAYQFLARASGGFTLYTNAAGTVGATLAAGSGTWGSVSDRNQKTNVGPVDEASTLAKLAALPISRWSYRSERGVRHVGPMAQDFYAAFGVGEDDKHITSIDEDGVALAAIKGLHSENVRLSVRANTQSAEIAALTASQAELRNEVAALRALVKRPAAQPAP